MKKLSKILSIALCLAMVLGLFTFGASAATTTKITTMDALVDGNYILVNNKNYALGTWDAATSWVLPETATTVTDSLSQWTLQITKSGSTVTASIKDASGNYLKPKGASTNGIEVSSTAYQWTVTLRNGAFIFSDSGDTVRLTGNSSSQNKFRAYKTSTSAKDGNENSYPFLFTLYSVSGDSGSGSGGNTPAPTPKSYMILADGKAAAGYTGTSGFYYPTAVTVEVNGTNVTGPNTPLIFSITEVEGGVTIKEPSGKYWIANDDTYTSVSVSDTPKVWTMTANGLTINVGSQVKTLALDTTRGSFGAYPADKLTADHVTALTFIENPTYSIRVEEKTIAEILAANSTGTSYKTTGKVNYISGKNVYIQDGTSAICAYFTSTPSGLSVGDVITVEGSYKVYKGLPELDQVASFTKTTGKDYTVKETTISALTNADICTAIKLTNLTIKSIGTTSNKPAYTMVDAQGKEIVWFNPVIGDLTLNEGDIIVSLECVVGCFNSLQLMNDAAADISTCAHANGGEWAGDENSHWKVCADCSAKFDVCDKELTADKDATHHWDECECGYIANKTTHDFGTEYKLGENGHYQECECGQKTTEEDHADGTDEDEKCDKCGLDMACPHTTWKENHDKDNHWLECDACEAQKNVTKHTLTTEHDKDSHWSECECGYASEPVDHKLTFKNDDKQHWSVCDCGYVSDKVNHKLTNNKCECGYEKPADVKGYSKLPITKPADVKEGYYVLGGTSVNAIDNGSNYTFLGNEPDAKDRINGVALNGKNNVVAPTGNEQVWKFIASGEGFKIKNVASGKYLYYKGSSNAIYMTENEAEAGIWKVVALEEGGWGLQDTASGRFLGVNRFGKEGSYYLGFAAYKLSQYVTGAIDLYVADANAKPTPNTGDGISAVVALLAVSGMGLVVLTAKKKED